MSGVMGKNFYNIDQPCPPATGNNVASIITNANRVVGQNSTTKAIVMPNNTTIGSVLILSIDVLNGGIINICYNVSSVVDTQSNNWVKRADSGCLSGAFGGYRTWLYTAVPSTAAGDTVTVTIDHSLNATIGLQLQEWLGVNQAPSVTGAKTGNTAGPATVNQATVALSFNQGDALVSAFIRSVGGLTKGTNFTSLTGDLTSTSGEYWSFVSNVGVSPVNPTLFPINLTGVNASVDYVGCCAVFPHT